MRNQLPYSISYENSRGESAALDELPFIVTQGDIFDSSWSFSTSPRPNSEGGRLISRRRSTGERSMTVQLAADDALALSGALEEFARICDHDLLAMTPGRLWVNGLYLRCYIVANEKTLSPDFPGMGQMRLTVLPELPAWCSERTYRTFTSDSGGIEYPYSYPYRYNSGKSSVEIFNDCGGACPMRVRFLGPVNDPRITVGGVQLGVNVVLEEGEYAVIDQLTRKVYKVDRSGARENCFDRRVKNGRCFEYLPAGATVVETTGCTADITVISMRSEPPWSS